MLPGGKMLKILDRHVLAYLNVQYGRVTKRFQRAHLVKRSENTAAPKDTNERLRSTSCAQVHYSPFPSYPFPNSIDLEDCLYVNIWAPVDENNDAFRPVVVVLAGGNFNAGGSGDYEFYDGAIMAALWNQVVVTPNYRVGLFGFLNELAVNVSENVAIADQELLFRWVQSYIHLFGGSLKQLHGATSYENVVNHYMKQAGRRPIESLQKAIGDFVVHCPMNIFAKSYASSGKDVYMYHFKHVPQYRWWPLWMGSPQMLDWFYISGNLLKLKDREVNVEDGDVKLSQKMASLLACFAETGRMYLRGFQQIL
ncbi:acetylcholinesterase-like [Ixodes scapularis]|uniref:acetylcholinesterase-like n=1 Tax=Ixodes scapularis TaxID=6945 RepID=UPI001A9FD595|nr:acetylcholinesterase-like [Ixodes scapularis]